jgi:hypothetical protein
MLAVLLSGCAAWALLSGDSFGAMLYPVAVNLGFLGYFLLSLRAGQSAIERIARIAEPNLPPEGVRYTRFLTKAWCLLFLINATLALLTALHGDRVLWALYNGVLGYFLVGAALLGERLLRPWLMRSRFWRPEPTVSLLSLLVSNRDPHSMVARRKSSVVTWGEFRSMVLAKAGAISATSVEDWLLGEEDAVEFVSSLLAVGLAGRHAIVPQNLRPDTLAALRARFPSLLRVAARVSGGPVAAPRPIEERSRVSFQTSGSTGTPTVATRTFRCLANEVAAHESIWGSRLAGAEFTGTVPHHFIYGALFRVLWPLVSGRVFDADPLSDGFAIITRLASSPRLVVVSSPSVLSRLPEIAGSLPVRPLAVFSSGSPLAASDARRCAIQLAPVTEVYGSTETGGVAWRQCEEADSPWITLPGVSLEVDAEGRLLITSPFASREGPMVVGDRVELLAHGGFRLLGRADRIAKVEGRRISLAELEATVQAEPWVDSCVVFPLTDGGRLAAAVVPRWSISQLDFPTAVAAIRDQLAQRHDPVVIPRVWRLLPSLPHDARGKVTLESLRASLWGGARHEISAEAAFPGLLSHQLGQDEAEISLHVPPELPLFAGHFPGHPILPGVSMIDWAVRLANAVFGFTLTPAGVEQLKFNQPTFPGERVGLRLRRYPDSVHFTYVDVQGNPKAAGILRP